MSKSICVRCRVSLEKPFFSKRLLKPSRRAYSAEFTASNEEPPLQQPRDRDAPLDISALLSKPTWSVRSLLPTAPPEEEITPKQLHHLLRLSALPLPATQEEEASMLATLHSQLYFVRDIQSVNTDGVEPLQSIRDETVEGVREATIGLDDLKEVLETEEFKGRNRRPRRRRKDVSEVEGRIGPKGGWDVFKTAGETVRVGENRFFVVRSGKEAAVEGTGVEQSMTDTIGEERSIVDSSVANERDAKEKE